MKNKKKDSKEREERPVELKDTVFFAERGRKGEILKGSVVVILEHCEFRLNGTVRTNKFGVVLKNDDIFEGLYAQTHGERVLNYEDFGKKFLKQKKKQKKNC